MDSPDSQPLTIAKGFFFDTPPSRYTAVLIGSITTLWRIYNNKSIGSRL